MNKLSKGGKWGIAISLIALFGGFIYWQYRKVLDYKYKLKSFKLEKLGISDTIISFVIKVKNKSIVKAEIIGYKFDLYLNNTLIGNVFSDKVEKIDSTGISELNINFQFNPQKVLTFSEATKFLSDIQLKKDNVYFRLVGTLNAKVIGAVELNEQKIDIKYTLKELLEPTPKDEDNNW